MRFTATAGSDYLIYRDSFAEQRPMFPLLPILLLPHVLYNAFYFLNVFSANGYALLYLLYSFHPFLSVALYGESRFTITRPETLHRMSANKLNIMARCPHRKHH